MCRIRSTQSSALRRTPVLALAGLDRHDLGLVGQAEHPVFVAAGIFVRIRGDDRRDERPVRLAVAVAVAEV
jgi:hypothetical protein